MNDGRFQAFQRHDVPLSGYELGKSLLMSIFFIPRVVATIILLALYALVCAVASAGLSEENLPEVYLGWRGVLLRGAQSLCWLSWLLSLGCIVRSKGDPTLKAKTGEEAQIVVSNHVSYMDVNAFLATAPLPVGFVAKRAIWSLPLIAAVARVWGCIPVDRAKAASASASAGPAVPGVIDLLRERVAHPRRAPVVVFPEGTTSSGEGLLRFKRGAFVPAAPVKPVILRYPHQQFNPAWESMTAPLHLWRLLTQFSNYCSVEWLPVYVPNEAEKKDPALFASNVREYMSRLSGLPCFDADLDTKKDFLKLIRGSDKLD